MHLILLCLAAAFSLSPALVYAQRQGATGSVEASASLFQGNTDQRAMFTKGEIGRSDSTLQMRASLSFGYADAARDSIPRHMTKRTWLGALSADYRPYSIVSPFVFLNYEASFEKRIQDRVGLGMGGKAVLLRSTGSEANVSVAMLIERLRPSRLSSDTATVTTARWSGRARVRHQFDPRLRMSHTTFFQPQINALNAYTVNSTSELSFAVRESSSITISYLSLYDTAARSRGARSNNDGQLLFGVKTSF